MKLEHLFAVALAMFVGAGLIGFGYTMWTMVQIYRCEHHDQCEHAPEWAKVKP
jgi:hypothetical protein